MFAAKLRFICRAPNRENGQLMLKRPERLDGFQARVFKDSFRMSDQLVDLLLMGWWGGNRVMFPGISIIYILVPTSLGSTGLWSACHHPPPEGRWWWGS